MKQTAVEWLFERLDISQGYESAIELLEQAKELERAEKDKQYQRGFKDGSNHIKIIYNL